MSRVVPGDASRIFRHDAEVVDYLSAKILKNEKRAIGTEWEFFLVDPEFLKNPQVPAFTRKSGQRAFQEFARVFQMMGYESKFIKHPQREFEVVGLEIPKLGLISPESGYQFEFACSVSRNAEEVAEKNEEAYRAMIEVALRLDHRLIFQGHLPGFAESSEGSFHSRSEEWHRYYESDRFSQDECKLLKEVQNGTASAQVTFDSGGSLFHEFLQALLLIEPAFCLAYANSERSFLGVENYKKIVPSQIDPLSSVWKATCAEDAVRLITERLFLLDVPFLPDPLCDGMYKAESLRAGRPPTVRDLMNEGRLNEQTLNNVGSFFYMRPALRNFHCGLIELRSPDSPADPGLIAILAQHAEELLYNDEIRQSLLREYAHWSIADIEALHGASVMRDRNEALEIRIGGITIAEFVRDILSRADSLGKNRATLPQKDRIHFA